MCTFQGETWDFYCSYSTSSPPARSNWNLHLLHQGRQTGRSRPTFKIWFQRKLVWGWFLLQTNSITKFCLLGTTLLYEQILPPACFCQHPVPSSHLPCYPKCQLLSWPLLLYFSYLSGPDIPFHLANPLFCVMHLKYSLPLHTNISGSYSSSRPTMKITPLIIKQWLALNCRKSYLFAFLHEFTKLRSVLSVFSHSSLWAQVMGSKCSGDICWAELVIFWIIALPFGSRKSVMSQPLAPHIC